MLCRIVIRFLLFAVLLLVPLSVWGRANLEVEGIDETRFDLNRWAEVVAVMHDRLTLEPPFSTLKIKWGNPHTDDRCGIITVDRYPLTKTDLGDAIYRQITHQYSHAKYLCLVAGASGLLGEGLAEAERHLTYQNLPGTPASTDVLRDSLLDNLPRDVGGGGANLRDNGDALYRSIAAKLELIANLLPGRNLNRFYEALAQFKPQNDGEYLAMLDAITEGKRIDGVLPSTFILRSQAAFLNGPNGTFFGISPLGKLFNDRYSGVESAINPTGITMYLLTREGGKLKDQPPRLVTFRWVVQNAVGNTVLLDSRTVNMVGWITGFSLPGLSDLPRNFSAWPDGAYKATVCVLRNNSCDPQLQDTTFFLVHRAEWDATNDIFVITNFPRYEDLAADLPLAQFTLQPGVVRVRFPGYLKFQMNRATNPLTIKTGEVIRTILPDHSKPRAVFFTNRDQPWLYSTTHAATFQSGPIVPGSIVTLWCWGCTHTDPVQSAALPLPTSSCDGGQGATKVLFTGSDNRTLEAPIFYCSQTQLNVQVPQELRGPRAKVKVVLNSTPSNEVEVDVAESNPGVFSVPQAGGDTMGAVLFNGEKQGQLVNFDNPAQPGDVLSIYATGLGPVDCQIPDGQPAPLDRECHTLLPVEAQLAGVPLEVLFSGLAPGFVGLNQVNVRIPRGDQISKDLVQPLVLRIGNKVSKQVMLAVRQ